MRAGQPSGDGRDKLPTVSVVIPAYNEEAMLPRCLASFRAQDYPGHYQVIVVDNGSTDTTAEMAHTSNAQVISCPRRGVVYARQAGAMAATGDLIVQADADSVYPADWLSRMAHHFLRHPRAAAVAGGVHYLNAPLWARILRLIPWVLNLISFVLTGNALLNYASSFAFRRTAFLKAGGYELALPNSGDEHAMLVRLRKVGAIYYDPRLLAQTSARRHLMGFWHFVFIHWLCRSAAPNVAFHMFRNPLGFLRPHLTLRAALLLVLFTAGLFSYGYFYPSSSLFGKVYASAPAARTPHSWHLRSGPSQKVVALTFDDGPNGEYTGQILDILKQYNVKATFFVVGQNAEYYPDLTRRILSEGHVLGNHSYSHKPFKELEPGDYKEFDLAEQSIQRIAQVRPHLFRPPYGRKTPWMLDYVRKKGLITVTWTVSANDPNASTSEAIAQAVIQHTHPGAIILLHDGNETHHNADRSKTVAALSKIIESLRARGYSFVTLDKLLNVTPYSS